MNINNLRNEIFVIISNLRNVIINIKNIYSFLRQLDFFYFPQKFERYKANMTHRFPSQLIFSKYFDIVKKFIHFQDIDLNMNNKKRKEKKRYIKTYKKWLFT